VSTSLAADGRLRAQSIDVRHAPWDPIPAADAEDLRRRGARRSARRAIAASPAYSSLGQPVSITLRGNSVARQAIAKSGRNSRSYGEPSLFEATSDDLGGLKRLLPRGVARRMTTYQSDF
jgi:hypothetical protein